MCVSACSAAELRPESALGTRQKGLAVYYSDSLQGRRTAAGTRYDKDALTAAHRTLPFGAVVRVVNLRNRRFVYVEINDRGPFKGADRIIDLSKKAAQTLDMIKDGVVPVELELIELPKPR